MVVNLPILINLSSESEYRSHYEDSLVKGAQVITADGYEVQFFTERFDHAFFRDSNRNVKDKAIFNQERAQRMDWIRELLESQSAEEYKRLKSDSKINRITLEPTTPYVVITQVMSEEDKKLRFITAYIVDSETALENMRSNPKW